MLPLVPVLDESRPQDRLGLHAVGQGLPDGNGRRCRNGARERPAPRATRPRPPDRQGATTEWARPGPATRWACSPVSQPALLALDPSPRRAPGEVQGPGECVRSGLRWKGPPGRSARACATSGMPARLRNVLRQHPRHRGSPSEPSGRSVTDWASVAVREAARGRKAARTRQAHVSAYS